MQTAAAQHCIKKYCIFKIRMYLAHAARSARAVAISAAFSVGVGGLDADCGNMTLQLCLGPFAKPKGTHGNRYNQQCDTTL